jgi:tRNA nucleotidyltransferase (CCA-adding enzyme)
MDYTTISSWSMLWNPLIHGFLLQQLIQSLPEVQALKGIPAGPLEHHPEGDAFAHTCLVMKRGAELSSNSLAVIMACALHDTGKALTDKDKWPLHHGHQSGSVQVATTVCDRLQIPERERKLILVVAHRHHNLHTASELTDKAWRRTFKDLDWDLLLTNHFITCCRADEEGRGDGLPRESYPAGELALQKFKELKP